MVTRTIDRRSARERLMTAADELFYEEGVHTVGIDRVIEHAGVAKGSLYNTFGSKDELIRAYLEGRHARMARRRIPPRRPGRAGRRGLPSLGPCPVDPPRRGSRRPGRARTGPPAAPALR